MIGSKIKQLRIQRGFTQDEMAGVLNLSQNAYSLIENGKTRLIDTERIKIIAEKLEVVPMELGLFIGMGIIAGYGGKIDDGFNFYSQSIPMEVRELVATLKEQLKIKDKQIEQLLLKPPNTL